MFFQPETLQLFVGGPQSRAKQQEEDCSLLGKPGTQDGSRGLPESAYNGKEEFYWCVWQTNSVQKVFCNFRTYEFGLHFHLHFRVVLTFFCFPLCTLTAYTKHVC